MTGPLITVGSGVQCIDGVCELPSFPANQQKDEDTMTTNANANASESVRSIITADDRFAVLDTIYRYATAIDIRDWSLFRTVFTDDAYVDFGFMTWDSGDTFTTFMQETHDPAGRTLHRMSNTVITDTGDENTIQARTYGDAVVLQADNTTGTIANAWYDDTLVRTAEGYRIARRVVHMISMRNVGRNLAAEM